SRTEQQERRVGTRAKSAIGTYLSDPVAATHKRRTANPPSSSQHRTPRQNDTQVAKQCAQNRMRVVAATLSATRERQPRRCPPLRLPLHWSVFQRFEQEDGLLFVVDVSPYHVRAGVGGGGSRWRGRARCQHRRAWPRCRGARRAWRRPRANRLPRLGGRTSRSAWPSPSSSAIGQADAVPLGWPRRRARDRGARARTRSAFLRLISAPITRKSRRSSSSLSVRARVHGSPSTANG